MNGLSSECAARCFFHSVDWFCWNSSLQCEHLYGMVNWCSDRRCSSNAICCVNTLLQCSHSNLFLMLDTCFILIWMRNPWMRKNWNLHKWHSNDLPALICSRSCLRKWFFNLLGFRKVLLQTLHCRRFLPVCLKNKPIQTENYRYTACKMKQKRPTYNLWCWLYAYFCLNFLPQSKQWYRFSAFIEKPLIKISFSDLTFREPSFFSASHFKKSANGRFSWMLLKWFSSLWSVLLLKNDAALS